MAGGAAANTRSTRWGGAVLAIEVLQRHTPQPVVE